MGGSSDFVYGGQNSGRLSSASNLSASAPPFTVGRSSGKSFSDIRLSIPDSYYGVEPFSEGWQYPQPSAPVCEPVMDSTGIASHISLPHEYQFSDSAYVDTTAVWSHVIPAADASGIAHGYGRNKAPSYSPSIPIFYGDHDMKPEGEASRTTKFPYAPSPFDLGRGLQGVDGLGFHVGKHAKIVEPGGDFSSVKENDCGLRGYSNQLNQGAPTVYKLNEDCWQSPAIQKHKYQHTESSNLSYQQSDGFSGGEVSNTSCSIPGEKPKGFPYYFTTSRTPDTSSTYIHVGSSKPEGFSEDFSSWNVNTCFADANSVRSLLKSPSGPVSTVRPSPSVIIRPPPAVLTEKTAKSTPCFAVDSYQSNISKQQDLGGKPSSETQTVSFGTSGSNFWGKGGGSISSAPREIPDRFLQADILGSTTISKVCSQVSELDSANGSLIFCNKYEAVKSCKDSSDIANNHNLEVDSPCWKGAPSSHISFLNFDNSSCNLVKKALHECDAQEYGKHHAVEYSLVEPRCITFEKTPENINDNKDECADGTGIDNLYFRREKHLMEATQSKVDISTVEGSALETSDKPNLGIDGMNGFEVKIPELMDTTEEEASGLVVNDACEGESTAVHVAEEALSSPVSAAEHIKLPGSRLDVATMIKALHNISELLLVHFFSEDGCMEVENIEDVKKVISNLNLCLSKEPRATDEPERSTFEGHVPRETLDLNKAPGTPIVVEESRDLQNEPIIHHRPSGSRNCGMHCERDKKCSYISVKDTDSALIADDDVAKGIKKVLEESFDFNEEMQPQSSLFKNLWLEAEARLCSMSFRANCNRMRIQMDEMQLSTSSEIEDSAGEKFKDSSNPIISPAELETPKDDVGRLGSNTQNISIVSTSMPDDDIESSIMARFNILKSRKETVGMEEEQKTEAVGDCPADSVMPSLSPLKSPGARVISIGKEKGLGSNSFNGKSDYQKYFELGFQPEDETMIHNEEQCKFHLHEYAGSREGNDSYPYFVGHPKRQSYKCEDLGSRKNTRLDDSFSLDWEHVPKDECLWRNY